jgi:hypothetical protein
MDNPPSQPGIHQKGRGIKSGPSHVDHQVRPFLDAIAVKVR